jgi:hypothetical protein
MVKLKKRTQLFQKRLLKVLLHLASCILHSKTKI